MKRNARSLRTFCLHAAAALGIAAGAVACDRTPEAPPPPPPPPPAPGGAVEAPTLGLTASLYATLASEARQLTPDA